MSHRPPHRPTRRRSDRLQRLAELLRTPGPQRAGALAELLQVSVPTLCRDVAELQAQGLPIEGNAGSGWRFLPQAALGPVHFSRAEVQALVAALRLAQRHMAPSLAQQAEAALERLLGLLPPEARAALVPQALADKTLQERLEPLCRAADAHRKLQLFYREPDGSRSEQQVWALGCECPEEGWMLTAWNEETRSFCRFLIERVEAFELLGEAPGSTPVPAAGDSPPAGAAEPSASEPPPT